MRTFSLVFAWLPLTMAFMTNGSLGFDYLIYSLLMLCGCVDICTAYYEIGCINSSAAISAAYKDRFNFAMTINDFDTAREFIRSEEMFIMKGAA